MSSYKAAICFISKCYFILLIGEMPSEYKSLIFVLFNIVYVHAIFYIERKTIFCGIGCRETAGRLEVKSSNLIS